MRAMELARTGRAEDDLLLQVERPDPEPGRGEILLEVEACGVCRTDLHILEGEVAARFPIIPGHQAAGRVAAVGPGVEEIRVGDLVGVGWLYRTCGECEACRSGRENLCASARYTGRDADGGYATRMVADARFAYPLPEGLPPADAAPLLCAGIIGYRSLKLSGIRPGGRLGLVGFGASAHLAIQVARHWGCAVYAFSREEVHRRLAREMGAEWVGEVADDPGVRLDAAVTFAPAGEVIAPTLAHLARGATIAINAIHMSPIPALSYHLLYWERGLRSVANYTRQDAEQFLSLAAEIPVRASVERFALDQANAALRRVKAERVAGAAVLEMPK
jgi:propanol-preferring alcohol dehydrogenase